MAKIITNYNIFIRNYDRKLLQITAYKLHQIFMTNLL